VKDKVLLSPKSPIPFAHAFVCPERTRPQSARSSHSMQHNVTMSQCRPAAIFGGVPKSYGTRPHTFDRTKRSVLHPQPVHHTTVQTISHSKTCFSHHNTTKHLRPRTPPQPYPPPPSQPSPPPSPPPPPHPANPPTNSSPPHSPTTHPPPAPHSPDSPSPTIPSSSLAPPSHSPSHPLACPDGGQSPRIPGRAPWRSCRVHGRPRLWL